MEMYDYDKQLTLLRHPQRPNTIDYIHAIFDDFIEIHGDRLYGDDAAIIGGIAFLEGRPVTVIGQVRGKNLKENLKYNFSMCHPEGYRKSLRLMEQAEKFKRPVICFVDTLGAYPGIKAEERGQSQAISSNLLKMLQIKVPVISVLIGNGCSGGALALTLANEIIMLENAILGVISPKGCANILWKDSGREMEAAKMLKMSAADMYTLGIADKILEEPWGGAHEDVNEMMSSLKQCLLSSLKKYNYINESWIVKKRFQKYRNIGRFID